MRVSAQKSKFRSRRGLGSRYVKGNSVEQVPVLYDWALMQQQNPPVVFPLEMYLPTPEARVAFALLLPTATGVHKKGTEFTAHAAAHAGISGPWAAALPHALPANDVVDEPADVLQVVKEVLRLWADGAAAWKKGKGMATLVTQDRIRAQMSRK